MAVKFALAQVGKPYVFGAAGPGAYDCSGLTMAAWQGRRHPAALVRGAVQLRARRCRSPAQAGRPALLLPAAGHVTIYVGDGLMVSAPEPGEGHGRAAERLQRQLRRVPGASAESQPPASVDHRTDRPGCARPPRCPCCARRACAGRSSGARDRCAGAPVAAAGRPVTARAPVHRRSRDRRRADRHAAAVLRHVRRRFTRRPRPGDGRCGVSAPHRQPRSPRCRAVPLAYVAATRSSPPVTDLRGPGRGEAARRARRSIVHLTLSYALRRVDPPGDARPVVDLRAPPRSRLRRRRRRAWPGSAAPSWRGPWDFGPIVVHRGTSSLVLGPPGNAAQLPARSARRSTPRSPPSPRCGARSGTAHVAVDRRPRRPPSSPPLGASGGRERRPASPARTSLPRRSSRRQRPPTRPRAC